MANLPRLLAGAMLLAAAGAASAGVIVVRSSGPSATQYPIGKSLADNARISLKGGDMVVVLDGKGSRTLKGPGTYPAAGGSGGGSATSFSALLASANGRRGRVGAVRPAPQPRQVWQVSADRSETFCFVAPGTGLRLRREDIQATRTVTIKDLASGKSAEVEFDAAQQLADWPTNLPVTDGNRYRMGSVETVMKAVDGGRGFADLGSAFVRAGCTAQLDALSTTAAYASAE
ncbi:hypothetical protein OMW55_12265 [Sphingomonas sp. BN140010]|uniref:Uncharacterized protein n=1 Tax=Sphingomonas arvum TaxID=2992113 RepID=A0ABT3JII3_9SPHN|nr:hypothetical protein [Sphingomonas sp. BN140010]MCW3798581.1 hypothetical protein [Sphingomonas sp. BN140010]